MVYEKGQVSPWNTFWYIVEGGKILFRREREELISERYMYIDHSKISKDFYSNS
jgi:hypothetical protein